MNFTLVKTTLFMQGIKKDVNGLPALYLNYLAGKTIPERARVVSGTIAQNQSVGVDELWLVRIQEEGTSTYENQNTGETETSPRYSHTFISQVSIKESVDMIADGSLEENVQKQKATSTRKFLVADEAIANMQQRIEGGKLDTRGRTFKKDGVDISKRSIKPFSKEKVVKE